MTAKNTSLETTRRDLQTKLPRLRSQTPLQTHGINPPCSLLFLSLKIHSGKETGASSWCLQCSWGNIHLFQQVRSVLCLVIFCFVLCFVKYNGWPGLFFPTSNCFTDQIASSPITFWCGRIMKDLQKWHTVAAVKSDTFRGSILILTVMIFDTLLKHTLFPALTDIGKINGICNPLCRWEGMRWFTGFEGANSHPLHVLCWFNG